MFSSTTYGLFETPIITNIGMITGVRCDGSYAIQSNPVINMGDFFRPRYESRPFEGRPIGDVIEDAQNEYKRIYEHNKSVSKEIQLNELKAENAMRQENEKKLAAERAMRDAAQKALAEEREKKLVEERIKREAAEKALADERAAKLAEEQKAHKLTAKSLSEYDKLMRKIAMKNLSLSSNTSIVSSNKSSKISSIKSSGMSTISSATSVSKMSAIGSVISDVDDLYNVDNDETEITFSDSASNSGSNSDSESENDSENNSDEESEVSTIISSKQKTIDPNEKSRFSNCTRCAKCFNGVSSVGFIIVNPNSDDHLIILGKSTIEDAFCDYSHKLKSNGKRSELPSERAEKIFKKMTDIDYDIDQHHFIDIPIKDNLHVHRVFIINYNSFKTKITINITAEYNQIGIFSMNTILDNNTLFENKQIYDNTNVLCNINKRMKKIIELYHKMYC